MPYYPSLRQTNLLIFLGCVGLMCTGYYMQYVMGLAPCPLCITQRFFICLAGAFGLLAALHNPATTGIRVYGALIIASVSGGAYFSGRQLYLQSLPPELQPACGPSLDYILETFPINEAFQVLIQGDGNCSDVVWQFLGISIPGWTLVAFAGIALICIVQIFRTYLPEGEK